MNGTASIFGTRLDHYARDVESFVSSPLSFLKNKQQADTSIVTNALIFLTISAALSAFLEVLPGSAKPQNLWQHAWESLRAHIFPSLLFAYLQAVAVMLSCKLLSCSVPWREVFSLYAYSLGALLIVRSITVSIIWNAIGVPDPVLDSIICFILLLLLTGMVLSGRAEWRMLSIPVIICTVLSGYVVGMFESAVKEPGPKIGFFEPVVFASRLMGSSPQPQSLGVGVSHGRLRFGDKVNEDTGKYEDTWMLRNVEKGDRVEVVVASRQFDTYVRIEADGGRISDDSENDDDPRSSTTDSRAVVVLPDGDQYSVVVTSYDPYETGHYVVDLQPAAVSEARPAAERATAEQENLFWQSIVNSTNPVDFEAYLEEFPNGVFRRLAQNRLAALRASANDSLVSVRPAGRRGGFGGFGLGCLKLPLRLRCANGSA